MFFVPPASAATLGGIDFSTAAPVADTSKALYDEFDRDAGRNDPSRCKAILRFPNDTIFWSSKMAIDADGSAASPGHKTGKQLDPLDGQSDTSFHFPDGAALSSQRHPYIVLPLGVFRAATGLAVGDLAAVVYATSSRPRSAATSGRRTKSAKVRSGFTKPSTRRRQIRARRAIPTAVAAAFTMRALKRTCSSSFSPARRLEPR